MVLIATLVVALATFIHGCDSALNGVTSTRVVAPASVFTSVTVLSNGDAVSVGSVNGAIGNNTAYGDTDFLIQRSSPSGEIIWTKVFGSAASDSALYVKSDSMDNIYVAGSTRGSFDGQTYAGMEDGAVVKLDSAGYKLFSMQFGGIGDENGMSICLDEANSAFYVTGVTTSQYLHNSMLNGKPNAFVSKYHSVTGEILNHNQGVTAGTTFYGCAVDTTGKVWVGGTTFSTAYYGVGGGGILMQRFGPNGEIYVNLLNGGVASSFTLDANDNKYLTGYSVEQAFEGRANAGGADVVVARYDSANNKVWAKSIGGFGDDYGVNTAVDLTSGRLYVTGETKSPVFPGVTGVKNPGSTPNSFLLVMNITDGAVLDVALFGTAGTNSKSQFVATSGHFTYLAGVTNGAFQGQAATSNVEHGYVLALGTGPAPSLPPTVQPVVQPTRAPFLVPPNSANTTACVLWALADYGESCSATCSGLQRVCKPKYFEYVTTQEGFYDVIGSAVNVRAGGAPIGSAQAFCSQATAASTVFTVPAVLSIVLDTPGNHPVRRTCTYPTSAATDCDAELPGSSSIRRFCPCVDHNCDDAFFLGYSGDSCGATCNSVGRTCDAVRLSDIVDATSFSAMVASTTAVDSHAPIGESAAAFCTLGTNLFDVATAPAAMTFVQGAVNQTLCAFPTSADQLHGDCDVSFTGAFPAQRFCNCRVPASAPHRQLTALPVLKPQVAQSPATVASPRLRRV